MSGCPKCQSPLPDTAFGLYTCTHCKSVLAIDFDGQATVADESPPTEVVFSEDVTNNSQESLASLDSLETPDTKFDHQEESKESLDIPVKATLETNAPSPDFSKGMPYELNSKETHQASSDFEDVIAFANSEISQGASGNFLYDILIKGIDSEDLRAAVREALTDKRFAWDSESLLKIKGGSIKIERVNAIKTSILVNRLKSYPLEISWIQNGIYELNP